MGGGASIQTVIFSKKCVSVCVLGGGGGVVPDPSSYGNGKADNKLVIFIIFSSPHKIDG